MRQKEGASVSQCLKKSELYIDGTIQPRYLTINERVRQFGGHPTYAKFLMYVGLGLLGRKQEDLYFKSRHSQSFVCLPKYVEDFEITKNFNGVDDFLDDMFPDIGDSEDIPETVILTTKNIVTTFIFVKI